MDQLLAMRVFVRIVEVGTFVKASDTLKVPRATVTKLVQGLERHLGVKLIQRTTRKLVVTPEGAAYYERAQRFLSELDDFDGSLGNATGQPKGRLRVDIGSSLANLILIPALPTFRARYPLIQLDLGVSDRPADLIGEGVDCVIRGGELTDSSLVARRIAGLDYITCAAPGYLRTHGVPQHPLELRDGHQIASYFSSLTGRAFSLYFDRGDEQIEIAGRAAVSVSESTAHLTALLAGLGIGQTFAFMARPHVESGALVHLLADWTRPCHPLQVVYPPNRHVNAKLRAFIDWAVKVFGAFSAGDS